MDCIDNSYFSDENLILHPERYVIIGFIAADGCIYVPKYGQSRLLFNLSVKDQIVLDIINNEICKGKRHLSLLKRTNSFMLYISSNQIVEDLSIFYIVPKKTKTLRLPKLSFDNMSYYLRGYFYGDGHFCQRTKNCSQYSMVGNKHIINDIYNWLISNKVVQKAYMYTINHSQDTLDLKISATESKKFETFLFKNNDMILLPRKHKCL